MARIKLRGVVVCAGAAVISLAVVVQPRAGFASDSGGLLSYSFAGVFDVCLDCSLCGEDGHKTFEGDDDSWYEAGEGGVHSQCWETGSCSDQHSPSCNIDTEEEEELAGQLEQLRLAVLAGDANGLATRLESANARITYNVRRGAIQVTGCQGHVIAHIPLDSRLQPSLAE